MKNEYVQLLYEKYQSKVPNKNRHELKKSLENADDGKFERLDKIELAKYSVFLSLDRFLGIISSFIGVLILIFNLVAFAWIVPYSTSIKQHAAYFGNRAAEEIEGVKIITDNMNSSREQLMETTNLFYELINNNKTQISTYQVAVTECENAEINYILAFFDYRQSCTEYEDAVAAYTESPTSENETLMTKLGNIKNNSLNLLKDYEKQLKDIYEGTQQDKTDSFNEEYNTILDNINQLRNQSGIASQQLGDDYHIYDDYLKSIYDILVNYMDDYYYELPENEFVGYFKVNSSHKDKVFESLQLFGGCKNTYENFIEICNQYETKEFPQINLSVIMPDLSETFNYINGIIEEAYAVKEILSENYDAENISEIIAESDFLSDIYDIWYNYNGDTNAKNEEISKVLNVQEIINDEIKKIDSAQTAFGENFDLCEKNQDTVYFGYNNILSDLENQHDGFNSIACERQIICEYFINSAIALNSTCLAIFALYMISFSVIQISGVKQSNYKKIIETLSK
ncbi:MAG: hypothetical protein ACI4MH_03410 [Candidatus Coproplasma sp.]